MSIGLALEIPTSLLEELTPRTDLDFVLAHKVLEDETYARFFAQRGAHRELLLDNSMHELGRPLPVGDLLEAAKRCRADFIIAPDVLDDAAWSLQQAYELRGALRGTAFKLAICLVGNSLEARQRYLLELVDADMLCLPYRRPRYQWWMEGGEPLLAWNRVHLLGVSELSELELWMPHAKRFKLSVDTAKPLKAGLLRKRLAQMQSLRGMPVSSKDLLELPQPDAEQMHLIHSNISLLRSLLNAND